MIHHMPVHQQALEAQPICTALPSARAARRSHSSSSSRILNLALSGRPKSPLNTKSKMSSDEKYDDTTTPNSSPQLAMPAWSAVSSSRNMGLDTALSTPMSDLPALSKSASGSVVSPLNLPTKSTAACCIASTAMQPLPGGFMHATSCLRASSRHSSTGFFSPVVCLSAIALASTSLNSPVYVKNVSHLCSSLLSSTSGVRPSAIAAWMTVLRSVSLKRVTPSGAGACAGAAGAGAGAGAAAGFLANAGSVSPASSPYCLRHLPITWNSPFFCTAGSLNVASSAVLCSSLRLGFTFSYSFLRSSWSSTLAPAPMVLLVYEGARCALYL